MMLAITDVNDGMGERRKANSLTFHNDPYGHEMWRCQLRAAGRLYRA